MIKSLGYYVDIRLPTQIRSLMKIIADCKATELEHKGNNQWEPIEKHEKHSELQLHIENVHNSQGSSLGETILVLVVTLCISQKCLM